MTWHNTYLTKTNGKIKPVVTNIPGYTDKPLCNSCITTIAQQTNDNLNEKKSNDPIKKNTINTINPALIPGKKIQ
jgi:hypothetical protein